MFNDPDPIISVKREPMPTLHDEIRSWTWDGLLLIVIGCAAALCVTATYVSIQRITEPEPKVLRP